MRGRRGKREEDEEEREREMREGREREREDGPSCTLFFRRLGVHCRAEEEQVRESALFHPTENPARASRKERRERLTTLPCR